MSSFSKRGAGIQFVLPPGAVVEKGVDREVSNGPLEPSAPLQPRGGVASIAMAVSLGRDVREQYEQQKARLAEYEKAGSPLIEIDPRRVRPSRYANRHDASFHTQEFQDFKSDLRESLGNLVPVKIRPLLDAPPEGPDFELVYGHRRHRGCLEEGLPLRALVQSVDDKMLFIDMDRENRGRASLSAWEQGVMYARALTEGLFPSQRILAAELGLSTAIVSRAVAIGNLPQEVIACFSSPLVVSYRHGTSLVTAVGADEALVLRRASQIFEMTPRPEDTDVLRFLVKGMGEAAQPPKPRVIPLIMGKRKVGRVRIAQDGGMSIEMTLPPMSVSQRERILEALTSGLAAAHSAKTSAA